MAAFPPSGHAPKHAVAGLGPELALILSLDIAAGAVQANGNKHATRKPVKVCRGNFRVPSQEPSSVFGGCCLACCASMFEGAALAW